MADPVLSKIYLNRLQQALGERGLKADIDTPALVAKNSQAVGTDATGMLVSADLAQKVELCELEDRGLWWCWVWAAPKPAERGAPTPAPEYEPMCPAEHIEDAARRITTVLGLRDGDATGEPSHA